jgi:hypothetical protein
MDLVPLIFEIGGGGLIKRRQLHHRFTVIGQNQALTAGNAPLNPGPIGPQLPD